MTAAGQLISTDVHGTIIVWRSSGWDATRAARETRLATEGVQGSGSPLHNEQCSSKPAVGSVSISATPPCTVQHGGAAAHTYQATRYIGELVAVE
jgi:hypothetical protein